MNTCWDNYLEQSDFQKAYDGLVERRDSFTIDEELLYLASLYELQKMKEFTAELAKLDTDQLTSPLQRARHHYLQALDNKYYHRVEVAYEHAKSGETLAKQAESRLQHDLANMCAIYLGGLGRVYLALDKFKEIAANPNSPLDIKEAAITNEAIYLFDLGQISTVKLLLPGVAQVMRSRLAFQVEIAEGKMDTARSMIKDGIPKEIPLKQHPIVVEYLALAVALLGTDKDKEDAKESWLAGYLEERKHHNFQAKFQMLLGLSEFRELKENDGLAWRYNLRTLFNDLLLALKFDSKEAAYKILKEKITPICNEKRVNNPLLPHLNDGVIYPRTPWNLAVERELGIAQDAIARDRITIKDGELRYSLDGKETCLDIKKSLKTLTLLKAIAGPKGQATTKQQIHEQLSLEDYNPAVHDFRIHKLLKRFEEKLSSKELPCPWHMPGDNTVVCNINIEFH